MRLAFAYIYTYSHYSISSSAIVSMSGTVLVHVLAALGVDVAVGAEPVLLMNATFSWARVNLLMCSISLMTQMGPPHVFMITKVRWNERMNCSFIENWCNSSFSRKIPVMVSSTKSFCATEKPKQKQLIGIQFSMHFVSTNCHWNAYRVEGKIHGEWTRIMFGGRQSRQNWHNLIFAFAQLTQFQIEIANVIQISIEILIIGQSAMKWEMRNENRWKNM